MESEAQLTQSIIEGTIRSYENFSSYVFNRLLNSQDILENFAIAYTEDEAGRAEIRDWLFDKLTDEYSVLEGYHYGQLQYHFPNGDSFLRFSDPTVFGDNLFSIRPTIKIANTEERYVAGYEAGRVFDGLRFVYPLFYEQKHIGSVELGVSLYSCIESVNKLFPGNNIIYIIQKERVEKIMIPNYMDDYTVSFASEDYMIQKDIFNLAIDTNHLTLPYTNEEFVRLLKVGSENDIGRNERFSYQFKFENKYYLVHYIPIEDALHQLAGYYISIYMDDHIADIHTKETITLSLLALLGLILMASTILYSSGKLKMYNIAITDSLTQIFSRRYFYSTAEKEMARSLRHLTSFCILMADIDNFKRVNDTYGHPAGDATLKRIAKLVSGMLRKSDVFARWGGEEFVLLMPGIKAAQGVLAAERIREIIESERFEEVGRVTVSVGVAGLETSDKSIDDIINRADEALYRAKLEGRNRVCMS